jgi:hypothetical protein
MATAARRRPGDVDDRLEERTVDGLAGEQQPEVDRAQHRLDHPLRFGAGGHLAALDRSLDDDRVVLCERLRGLRDLG